MRSISLGRLFLITAPLALACVTTPASGPQHPATPPGSFKLLERVADIPTDALRKGERREDLEIRTTTWDTTPSVITRGDSPEIVLGPASQLLVAGSADGKSGWSVDNFILWEVVDAKDQVTARFVSGFHEPVYFGPEMIESIGPYTPNFEAGIPDLAERLPRDQPFRLRATALDYGNVGSVTEIWLIVNHRGAVGFSEDLRDD